jgi:hypothetical protein
MVMPKTNVITASGDLVNITGTVYAVPTAITFLVAQSGLAVQMSGQGVLISGQQVEISGQPVALVSGTIVTGQSGLNVVVQSGLGITPPKSLAIRIRAPQMLSDISGGVTLVSGLVTKVLIRSLDGDVYVGGVSGIDMPYSGFGMLLQRDDIITLPIDNFNLLNAYAIISGYRISYGGVE